MGHAAMALALVGARDARGQHRRASQRRGRVRGVGCGEPSVAEARARADDPRSDRADDRVVAPARRPRERGRDADALLLPAEAGAD